MISIRSSFIVTALALSAALSSALFAATPSVDLPVITTNHYRLHSDVDRALAEDIGQRMDVMFDEYSHRLVDFKPREDERRFDVYVFARRAGYVGFTKNRFPNTGGVFMANKALAAFLEGQGRDTLRRTLQHEAFHQFAFSAIGPNLPVWLNEGLAQIFEEGIYNGQRFSIGQVPPRRIRQLQSDIEHGKLLDFRMLMSMSNEQWASNMRDPAGGTTQYNQAWAMTHFLVFAADEHGTPRFRSRLIDMLRLIRAGKSGDEAFSESFSDNIDGFHQMFLDFARQVRATPEATYIEHQDVLADMLIDLKSHGLTFSDINIFRRQIVRGGYQVEYTKGQLHWKSDPDPRDYFRDLDGKDLSGNIFFEPNNDAPLPDLISRPGGLQYHTRFTQNSEKVEHEILVEVP